MALKIKFGTDGWRAIIAEDFTTHNVARLAKAVSTWAKEQSKNPKIVIGYDCRFGGRLFAQTAAMVLLTDKIQVIMCRDFVSTPVVSLATRDLNCIAGIMITASHNPPDYNGFKLKGSFGGPLQIEDLNKIEKLIPDDVQAYHEVDMNHELLEYVDLEENYYLAAEKNFNLELIRNSKLNLAYDAMYGSGQIIVPRLIPNIEKFRCEFNPSFNGISPEPIERNLKAFSAFIKSKKHIDCALVTDGDADRIGMMDGKGNYVDAHHLMLILIHYLAKYKGQKGKIITGFSSVTKIKKLCEHYDLPLEVVPIGFKHASAIMIREEILLAGEESGGIAVSTHLPERDGVWMGLMIFEFMANTGKQLTELIDEVYEIVGPFNFQRRDLEIDAGLKKSIIAKCKSNKYSNFGDHKILSIDKMDGFKYQLSDNSWVMIRPSGTEPVLRIYAEAIDENRAIDIITSTEKEILN